jgi:hypothetical protein
MRLRNGIAAFGGFLAMCGNLSAQQFFLEPEFSIQQVQATPAPALQPAPAPAPRPAPAPAPFTPTTPGTPGAVRSPVSTAAPQLNLTSSGTSARPVELPNLYGDFQQFGTYSPFLQAITPTGQTVTVLPGQSQRFPAGTVFNQAVSGFNVLTTQPNVPFPDVPLPPGFREKLGQRETVVPGSLTRGSASTTDILVNGPEPRGNAGGLPVPVVRGAYKISENEGPRPVDRVYVSYNFFHDINPSLSVPGLPIINVHRQTFGIEKTFLDGDASIGLRLPLIQITGPSNLDRATVGDLSVILKFALINNPFQPTSDGSLLGGEVLSTGIVITAPTGGAAAFTAQDPIIHPTLIQPFIGGIKTFRNSYFQFISSIAVPTDSRDTTYMFNTMQYGYLLYRNPTGDRIVNSITPIAELHVNTPFNNRPFNRLPIGATDIISTTVGASLGIGSRSSLNVGTNVPISGPRPYTIESIIQLNVRF